MAGTVKFTVQLKSTPLNIVVWDVEASRVVGDVLADEIRTQARQGASGVAGAFPRGAKGQRVTLTDTGRMLDSLHSEKVTAESVTVLSDADYSGFVDDNYPHMGISTKTEIALLQAVVKESERAFERANSPEGSKIIVDKQGRGRDS